MELKLANKLNRFFCLCFVFLPFIKAPRCKSVFSDVSMFDFDFYHCVSVGE